MAGLRTVVSTAIEGTALPSEALLDKYADVAVKVGIGLQAGDRLLIRSSTDAVDLTRRVADRAYAAGAVNVDVFWSDDAIGRSRFSSGPPEASEVISTGAEAFLRAFEMGDLVLSIVAQDPDALAGLDVARIGAFQKVNAERLNPVMSALGSLKRNWSIVAAPTPAWASKVFPGVDEDDAVERLWDAIFRATRIDADDPVVAWQEHLAGLAARKDALNSMGLTALQYRGPGTDLRMELPEGVLWEGGGVATPEGRHFLPNIPTEEVFTSPHRMKAEGQVTASKPLSLFGNLVDGFSFEVRDGEIVSAHAERGQDVLDQLLATDEGSMRFGEAAMVPMSSAVAAEALIWNNTLYDENDGCHIAIGRAYPVCLEGGTQMSPEEQVAAGLNHSTTHVDFVVGSPQLDVVGITADGAEHPIISGGEWGFELP